MVAGELERRWNEALQVVNQIEGEIAAIIAAKPPPLGERERQQLMQLGADLELAWSHPGATAAARGEITLDAAAEIIGVAKMTALRMIRTGDLKGRQVCKGAP